MSSKNENIKGSENLGMKNLNSNKKNDTLLPFPKIESDAQISNLASFLRSNSSIDSPSKINMMTVNFPLTPTRPRITDRYRFKDSRRNSNVIESKQIKRKDIINSNSNAKPESQNKKTTDYVTDNDCNLKYFLKDKQAKKFK